jgi:hypothetical protein
MLRPTSVLPNWDLRDFRAAASVCGFQNAVQVLGDGEELVSRCQVLLGRILESGAGVRIGKRQKHASDKGSQFRVLDGIESQIGLGVFRDGFGSTIDIAAVLRDGGDEQFVTIFGVPPAAKNGFIVFGHVPGRFNLSQKASSVHGPAVLFWY